MVSTVFGPTDHCGFSNFDSWVTDKLDCWFEPLCVQAPVSILVSDTKPAIGHIMYRFYFCPERDLNPYFMNLTFRNGFYFGLSHFKVVFKLLNCRILHLKKHILVAVAVLDDRVNFGPVIRKIAAFEGNSVREVEHSAALFWLIDWKNRPNLVRAVSA